MDLHKIISELQAEKGRLDRAIAALEKVAVVHSGQELTNRDSKRPPRKTSVGDGVPRETSALTLPDLTGDSD